MSILKTVLIYTVGFLAGTLFGVIACTKLGI